MNLLRIGRSRQSALNSAKESAVRLTAEGITFAIPKAAIRVELDDFLDAVVPTTGAHVREKADLTAFYASDGDGGAVGAITFNVEGARASALCLIRKLGVAEDFRGRGIARVLLGMLDLTLPRSTRWIAGNCAPADSRFYQKCGFTVLQPGEPLELPDWPVSLRLSDQDHPCWFVMQRW